MVPDLLILLYSYAQDNYKIVYAILAVVLYYFYYRFFRVYVWHENGSHTQGKHIIGKTLPCYPNGWFIICRSELVKVGETMYISQHGENLVVFRGTNKKVFVLDAYCPHMGANLGINGVVINEKNIKCPFHGWIIDGETGELVNKDNSQKKVVRYEYEHQDDKYSLNKKQCNVSKTRRYEVRDIDGLIHVWFHSKEEFRNKPQYEPFDCTKFSSLEHRGNSNHYVNSHLQDIAENGGDIMHFPYIHSTIIPMIVS